MNVREKSEYTEKILILTTKIELLYRNLYKTQCQKNLNLESGYIWISLNFSEKIWMIQIKSEWMAGLDLSITVNKWALTLSRKHIKVLRIVRKLFSTLTYNTRHLSFSFPLSKLVSTPFFPWYNLKSIGIIRGSPHQLLTYDLIMSLIWFNNYTGYFPLTIS